MPPSLAEQQRAMLADILGNASEADSSELAAWIRLPQSQ